jgi:tRNA 2-thiocytidine biosynthesis protein TtcA
MSDSLPPALERTQSLVTSPRPASQASPGEGVPWVARVQASQKGRDKSKLGRKITRTMMQTIERWKLVEAGDKIMVAVSGGKDSYTLLDLLWEAKSRAPFSFDVIAVHLDQVQPGYDGTPLLSWLTDSKIPFQIIQEDTYSIVVEGTKQGQAYCFLCSRLRRGILYSQAERLGCNKIALGHHRDDALETMLMNLCYAGKLQAMPARYLTDDARFTVIRPLIDCAEKDIAGFAQERGYPILPCNLCGSQDGLKRDAMNDLLATLEKTIPDVRAVMHNALSNVRPTHLLDKDVVDAWAARPPSVRPKDVSDPGPRRMTGEVVFSSPTKPLVVRGALPIVADGSGGLGSDEPA